MNQQAYEEEIAQIIFDVGFVKKAGLALEDCRYIVGQFGHKLKAYSDMYEALQGAKEWIAELQNSSRGLCEDEGLPYSEPTEPCGLEMEINKAIAKAEGKEKK